MESNSSDLVKFSPAHLARMQEIYESLMEKDENNIEANFWQMYIKGELPRIETITDLVEIWFEVVDSDRDLIVGLFTCAVFYLTQQRDTDSLRELASTDHFNGYIPEIISYIYNKFPSDEDIRFFYSEISNNFSIYKFNSSFGYFKKIMQGGEITDIYNIIESFKDISIVIEDMFSAFCSRMIAHSIEKMELMFFDLTSKTDKLSMNWREIYQNNIDDTFGGSIEVCNIFVRMFILSDLSISYIYAKYNKLFCSNEGNSGRNILKECRKASTQDKYKNYNYVEAFYAVLNMPARYEQWTPEKKIEVCSAILAAAGEDESFLTAEGQYRPGEYVPRIAHILGCMDNDLRGFIYQHKPPTYYLPASDIRLPK